MMEHDRYAYAELIANIIRFLLDYKEEQASELEALRSIYSNEEFTGDN